MMTLKDSFRFDMRLIKDEHFAYCFLVEAITFNNQP